MSKMRERVQAIARFAKENAQASQCEVDVIELVNWVYAVQRVHHVHGQGVGLGPTELIAGCLLELEQAGGGWLWGGFETLMRLGVFVDGAGDRNGRAAPGRARGERMGIRYAAGCAVPPGADIPGAAPRACLECEPLYDAHGRPGHAASRSNTASSIRNGGARSH
jgi:hypothetical protein